MFHYCQPVNDIKGNALTGYYIGLVEPDANNSDGGTEALIYADDAGTPIIASSGIDNRAIVDGDGMVSLYVPIGDYHVDIYAIDGVTRIKRLLNLPMRSGEPGVSPTVTIGTVTTVSAGSPATVSNSGTANDLILDFGIPMGITGSGTGFTWGAATGDISNQTDLQTALDSKAPLASPAFTGSPTAPTPADGDNSTKIATTGFVNTNTAPLASPAFTGTPTAPTASANTNTTQIATTAFVLGQANSTAALIAMNGSQGAGTSLAYARADHVHPTDTSRAPLASPGFSGTPTAPTASAGTNNTQIATTAFVQSALSTVSDQWVILKLTGDNSGTASSFESTGLTVAGANFLANHYYEFEAQISVKVASGSMSLGLAWPAGVTGAASIVASNGSTAVVAGADSSAAVSTGLLNSTSFIPVTIRGQFYTGASAATGSLDIQYKNTPGSAVHTISKGSVLRYRAL